MNDFPTRGSDARTFLLNFSAMFGVVLAGLLLDLERDGSLLGA